MECKDCQSKIRAFIKNKVSDADIKRILSHVNECEECREELEVQYLVLMAVDMNEGHEYEDNSEKAIRDLLKRRRKTVKLNNALCILGLLLILCLIPDFLLLLRFLF